MSELRTLARPYARAAFAVAEKHGDIEAWRAVLSALSSLASEPRLRGVLRGPRRGSARLAEEVLNAFGGEVNDRIRNFVRLVALRQRLPLLAEIRRLFAEYEAEAAGRDMVKVVTARALNAEAREKMAAILSQRRGREVDVTYAEDEDLLAGVLVRVGDRVTDSSLKSRLQGLTAALKN